MCCMVCMCCLQSMVAANSSLKAVLQQRDAELAAQRELLQQQSELLQQQSHDLACSEQMLEVGGGLVMMHSHCTSKEGCRRAAAAARQRPRGRQVECLHSCCCTLPAHVYPPAS